MSLATLFTATAFAGLALSSILPRQHIDAAMPLPVGAPNFTQSMSVQRTIQDNGFVATMRDEGYKGVCTIVLPSNSSSSDDDGGAPTFDAQKCDKATWQWRFSSWTNASFYSYAMEHALQDSQNKTWVKTVGGDVTLPAAGYVVGARDWSAEWVNVTAAPDGWSGDVYPQVLTS